MRNRKLQKVSTGSGREYNRMASHAEAAEWLGCICLEINKAVMLHSKLQRLKKILADWSL